MTTMLFDHTTANFSGQDVLGENGEIMRYIDIIRFIVWILELLRKLIGKRRKKNTNVLEHGRHSLNRDEFGYINWNGAY